jgi:predicted pyridoxine 5'-phosphate oxidase superfamily flavin-nucleotide-binding protein
MSRLFGAAHRLWQQRFYTKLLADLIEERLCRDHINDEDKAFIERLDMFFLASVDAEGQPTGSYKGGDPGFVRVLDQKTVLFPCYDGNGMFLSVGNLSSQQKVGLLFIDLKSPKRLRVHGIARVESAEFARPAYLEAQFVIAVTVTEVFPNCPRYIHRYQLVERSKFVPRPGTETPVPGWKQSEWARDVLPVGDTAAREATRDS